MKLTKDQRHTAYILMLAEVEERQKLRSYPFLCFVAESLFDIKYQPFKDSSLKIFIELYDNRPKSKTSKTSAWYHPIDYQSRINVLKKAIKETYNF